MTSRELIELAALEALGLLDESEQAEFDRAFRSAPAALRAQLRAEQARVAELDQMLPNVDPPDDLRERVIGAVRDAVEAEAAGTARSVVHRPGRVVPRVSRSRRVSPLWRAAAIGLSVAVLVLGILANQLLDRNRQLGDQVIVAEYFNSVGTRHLRDTLFNANTKRAIFSLADSAPSALASAQAVLLYNPDWKTARFISEGLSGEHGEAGTFQLCVVDEDNKIIRTVNRFQAEGGRFVSFDVELKLETGARLALFIDNGSEGVGPLIMLAQRLS